YRFTLDITAVPVLKELSHLPVIVDPSHAAGRRDLVTPLSLAAAAAGADGIIVETHPAPEEAICDGPQAIRTDDFALYAARVEAAAVLDEAYASVGEARDGAEIAVVATPLGVLPATLDAVLAAAPSACAVTDVGSAKRLAMRDDERFVGGHPLAGSELGGVEHAR